MLTGGNLLFSGKPETYNSFARGHTYFSSIPSFDTKAIVAQKRAVSLADPETGTPLAMILTKDRPLGYAKIFGVACLNHH